MPGWIIIKFSPDYSAFYMGRFYVRSKFTHKSLPADCVLDVQCSRAKEQIFYFYLIFDRRHVYLLGNTKNQRNNYKLTDSFEIEPICLFSILCTEL